MFLTFYLFSIWREWKSINLRSSPISSLCLIVVSAFEICTLRETFFDWSLSIKVSFYFNLSIIYLESFSASYFPIRPFSAALRKRPKSKASFLISAIWISVPSRIAFSLSRRVSDLSLPSSMLDFKVSNSALAISYFWSGVRVALSLVRRLPRLFFYWSSSLRSSFCLRSR